MSDPVEPSIEELQSVIATLRRIRERGAIEPDEAIARLVIIRACIQTHLKELGHGGPAKLDPELAAKLSTGVRVLSLPTRVERVLVQGGQVYIDGSWRGMRFPLVGDVVARTADELLCLPNLGKKGIEAIRRSLAGIGLKLKED